MHILTSVRWYLTDALICISLKISECAFSCAYWPLEYLLWKNVYSDLLPIFWFGCFLILSCMSCLHILKTNPLSVASFANIFSQFVSCFFILLMVSFAMQKLLSLIRSHLSVLAFVSFCPRQQSKTILLWFMSKSVLLMFSSRNFMLSGLIIFKPFWVHFYIWYKQMF